MREGKRANRWRQNGKAPAVHLHRLDRGKVIQNYKSKLFKIMENSKSFSNIEEAARFISENANTGSEHTVNDCICFGMGVYAYTSECKAAGISAAENSSTFHHLNGDELLKLLAWLQDNDGYLIAA